MTTAALLPRLELPPDDENTHIQFGLTPTQMAFVTCGDHLAPGEAIYPVLIGPEGEGKTHAAIAALFAHKNLCHPYLVVPSTGQRREMMGLIVRDTGINIRRHTVRSIEKICGNAVEIREKRGVFGLYAQDIICDMIGMDNVASSAKIQGGEYDWIWLEEPAPIIHTGNSGISADVYITLQRRIRGGDTPKRLQVSMNPAALDHWTHHDFIENPVPEIRIFRIRKGENPFMSKADRERRARAFATRPDLARRYDEGEFSNVFAGLSITPEFSERMHMHSDHNGNPLWLLPMPGIELVLMFDGGLNPSCIIMQVTPSGHFHFLDAIVGENMGMRQMIRTRLKKVLARPRYDKCTRYRIMGDPALDSREQSDSDHRASLVIQEELGQPGRSVAFEKGVSDWQTRSEGLKEMFNRMIDGVPMVRCNPRPTEGEPANVFTMVFGGGYQYQRNAAGQVIRHGPVKNKWSHPGDAMSHCVPLLLFPVAGPAPPIGAGAMSSAGFQRSKGYAVRS